MRINFAKYSSSVRKLLEGLCWFAIAMSATAIIFGGVTIYDFASEPTYKLECKDQEILYGEGLNLDDIKITSYSKVFHRTGSINPDNTMISYDAEFIGTQTATVEYKGLSVDFNVTILTKKLSTPVITHEDGLIKWDKIPDARGYEVICNGKSYTTSASEYRIDTSNDSKISVKVRAFGRNGKILDSDFSNTIDVVSLKSPEKFSIEGENLVWSTVEGAINYEVKVNNVNVGKIIGNSIAVKDLSYGINNVSITAYGAENTIHSKSLIGKVYRLNSAKNIVLTKNNLSWDCDDYDGAVNTYEITINGVKFSSDKKVLDYDFAYNKYYNITIKTITKSNVPYFESELINEYNLSLGLEPITDVKVENGILKWNSVTGAYKYEIYLNGDRFESLTNEISNLVYIEGANEIKVQAFNETGKMFNEVYACTIVKYSPVKNLTVVNNEIKWDSDNECKYEIKINGEVFTSDVNSYHYDFEYAKFYDITVRCMPVDSEIPSEETKLKKYNLGLTPITYVNYENGKIIWNNIEKASKYEIYVNGVRYESNTNSLSFKKFNVGENTIKINVYNNEGFKGSEQFIGTLNKLESASDIKVENKVIKWNSNNENCSYEVIVNGEKKAIDINSLEFDFQYNTKYEIEVICVPNDKTQITSESAFLYDYNIGLADITNIYYEDGSIKWNAIDGATKYEVIVNDKTLTSNANTLIYKDFNVGENTVSITAINNDETMKSNKADGVLTKLSIPTNVVLEPNKVTWDAVNDLCEYNIKIDNKIYHSQTRSLNYDFKDRQLYQISIAATGSNQIIDSDYSDVYYYVPNFNGPDSLSYNDGRLNWSKVINATSYSVTINNEIFETNTNNLEFSDFIDGENSIEIIACGYDNLVTSAASKFTINKLYAPNDINVVKNKIIWSSNNIDCSYEIYINNERFESNTNSLLYLFDYNRLYDIKVISISNNELTVSSNETVKKNYNKGLANLTGGKYIDDNIVWNPVEGAKYYEVTINDVKEVANSSSLSKTNFASGENIIKIQAFGEINGIVLSSEIYEFSLNKLNEVTDITLDKNQLNWISDNSLCRFDIYIDNVLYTSDTSSLNFEFEHNKLYTIKIKAKALDEQTISSDDVILEGANIGLDDLTYIQVDENYLVWVPVIGADKYVAKIGEEIITLTESKLDISSLKIETSIELKAVNEFMESKGQTVIVNVLKPVTNLKISSSGLTWDNPNPDCKFRVEINGQKFTVDTNSMTYAFNNEFNFKISVQAISDNPLTRASEMTTLNYVNNQLSTPVVDIRKGFSSDEYRIVITNVPYADKYKITVKYYFENGDIKTRDLSTNKLTKNITVDENVVKIEVSVIAQDSTQKYNDSQETIVEKEILK